MLLMFLVVGGLRDIVNWRDVIEKCHVEKRDIKKQKKDVKSNPIPRGLLVKPKRKNKI